MDSHRVGQPRELLAGRLGGQSTPTKLFGSATASDRQGLVSRMCVRSYGQIPRRPRPRFCLSTPEKLAHVPGGSFQGKSVILYVYMRSAGSNFQP